MAKAQTKGSEIRVKVADQQLEFLENRAKELGLSKAALVRWYIVNDMVKADQQVKKEPLSLKGIFKGGGPIPEEDIDEVIKEWNTVRE